MDPSFFARKRPREEGRPAPTHIRPPHILGWSNPASDDRPVFFTHARSPVRNPQYAYHSIDRQISTTTLPANRPKPATTTRERPTSVLEPNHSTKFTSSGEPLTRLTHGTRHGEQDHRQWPLQDHQRAQPRCVSSWVSSPPTLSLSHVLPPSYSLLPRQAERPWSIAAST